MSVPSLGITSTSFDPPAQSASISFAAMVDPTGSTDCAPSTWANGVRQITITPFSPGILATQAQNNYTHIFLKNEKTILVSRTLLEFEKLLGNYYFFRIHQSHLINLRHVQEYDKGQTGVIVMSDGTRLEVSRRKKPDLMQALSEFSLIL